VAAARGLFGVPHELDDLGRFAQVYVEFVLPVGEVLDGGYPFTENLSAMLVSLVASTAAIIPGICIRRR
jgi:hypothetical protein